VGGIVRIYPAHFFPVMLAIPRNLIRVCICLLLASAALIDAASPGFLEGHLKIISPKEVELADETPSKMTAENYPDYPLVILSREKRTEVANVTADENGNYRISLPPGDYVLDVQNRKRRHVRATLQSFTIVANQTVRVDMAIDTGVR
jgi:Carboxypeptidase regulatory-like domain